MPILRVQTPRSFPEAMVKIWNFMDENSLENIPTARTISEYIPPVNSFYRDISKKHEIGYPKLRRILNYPSLGRRPPNFYTKPENFYVDLWSAIDKNKVFPTMKDLEKLGIMRLSIPIKDRGGFPAVANSMGLKARQSTSGVYSQYKGDVTESYLVPPILQAAIDNKYIIYPGPQAPIPIITNEGSKNRELEIAFWKEEWEKNKPHGDKIYQHGVDVTANNNLTGILEQKLGDKDGYHKGLEDFGIPIVSDVINYKAIKDAEIPKNTELILYKDILDGTDSYFGRLFDKKPLKLSKKTKVILRAIASSDPKYGKEGLEEKIEEIEKKHKQKELREYLK